ncbi:MAG: ATPase, T2SS/T4P/T4SS family [Candidatus Omnitrophica bacterium]|nr:ATPase, T2SS/T4P/T4SS family [Candidatus Omnitrophota bacterium]MDD5352743.1 ATPase, T2SS/T4P/T4SS family [Candidatus Omnitrophota bacterium]MDD5550342.1 ATPase, T2SS/T4P/T4SS family [Candidatus Omnitrophota bacterium]
MGVLKKRLTDILIESKNITPEQLAKALEIQKNTGQELRSILIKEGFITEHELLAILSKELFIPYLDLSRYKIDPQIFSLIPEKVSKQYKVVAVSLIGNTLTVAMFDPLNIFAIDDLKVLTGYEIDPVIASEKEIFKIIDNAYGKESTVKEISEMTMSKEEDMKIIKDEQLVDIGNTLEDSQRAPIVRIVDLLIIEAMRSRASDIHVEPAEKELRVRYRIDGHLHDVFRLPRKNQNAILARLKIISGLDITESRLPQDGRFKARLKDKEIDFRVSALPTTFGQKFVLRTLDRSKLSVGLDHIDMSPEPLHLFQEAVTKPYGMILVTGPTGCGKSTTLYSIINQLNSPNRNIVTVEDPVEYQVEGITQLQVKPEIGLSFASGLRSILRQSPDIILVGEIRDFETADIAIKASLTGQLVLSTLHTNDACGAITRLIDMGVESFLIASSLVLSSAQRLCRRICPRCKTPDNISRETLEKIGIYDFVKQKNNPTFYVGAGCSYCNNTGYFERIGIHEVIMIDDEIRGLIINKASSDQIKDFVVKNRGFKTLRDDALEKWLQGITTLEEVIRVTTQE